ncbi:MAG: hypothetical protein V1861_02830, partial [Candidatus Micrarchaeota archaeon]
ADPERRLVNSVIAETCLYHVVDSNNLATYQRVARSNHLPPALYDERVLREIDIFSKLTELERNGAQLSEFTPLLNNGKPPLALLVKLADYAVTHTAENRLKGLIDPDHGSIFRAYDSIEHAHSSMRMDAIAGERLYAPVAELFGFPAIAGIILKHSFQINHPEIYSRVMEVMEDQALKQRLALTRGIVQQITRHLRVTLAEYGFEAEVTIRSVKSEGKVMRKTLRLLKYDFDADAASKIISKEDYPKALDSYVKNYIGSFDFERMSDLVAYRVKIQKYKGREIDSMGAEEKEHVLGIARAIMDGTLTIQGRVVSGGLAFQQEFIDKDNGYKAYHWHVSSMSGGTSPSLTPLNLEGQLKTEGWHQIAERGGAAHHYYIGGDTAFMDMLDTAYHTLLYQFIKGNGHSKGAGKPAAESQQMPLAL